jgi:hypothetical protein
MNAGEAQTVYDKMNDHEREQVELWMACHDVTFEQAVEIMAEK